MDYGLTPMTCLRQRHPNYYAAIALLEQALADVEKTWLLVKARVLAVSAASNTVAPSCLQHRITQGQPLPGVALAPLTDSPTDDEHGKEYRKLRTTLAFMCGLRREAMPRDVFRVVMDLLMPSWGPLRRKNTAALPQVPQG